MKIQALRAGDARKPNQQRRRVREAKPINDSTFSAYLSRKEDVSPRISSLYVARGNRVANVTYGRGVIWCNITEDHYELLPTDTEDSVDCQDQAYDDGKIDCLVLDSPCRRTPGGTAHGTRSHQGIEKHYLNNGTGNSGPRRMCDNTNRGEMDGKFIRRNPAQNEFSIDNGGSTSRTELRSECS